MPTFGTGDSESLWLSGVKIPAFPVLKKDLQADVCVVGAGIAGLTAAYMLAVEGRKVVVLDERTICGGESSRTTAHLSNAIDDRFFEIERLHGARKACLTAESHSEAIDQIEAIVAEHGIKCAFKRVDGYLFVPEDADPDVLEREYEAAHFAGLTGVHWVKRAPLPFDTGRCLCFPRQGQFHPLQYLAAIAEIVTVRGGVIFTGTRVCDVEGGSTCRIRTEAGPVVTAGSAVVATNTPFNDRFNIHSKQSAYRTYVLGARIPKGSVTQALYWDTMDPYHYVRIAEDTHRRRHSKKVVAASDILIIGGADHKTGQSGEFERPYEDLEEWARQRFPSITDIPYRWSGQVMETIDGLGFIGLNPDDQNVYVATGDSGMGMTHGTIGGMLVSDLIQGRSNPWTELYEPSRLPPAAVNEFAKENLNVLVQYTDWIDKGDVESLDDIERGSGAVYVEGFDKWAAYRDHDGNLQQCSAVCPHLGCIVNWNSLEHTWDCPCHGSRFAPDGKVLNGPASEDLAASREWKESSVRNLFLLFWNGGGLVINTGLALAMTILAPFRWLDSRAKGERHSKHEGSAAPRPSVPRRSSPKW